MSTQSVVILGGTGVINGDDTASPSTLALRNNLGGLAAVQMLASELKTSGVLTANQLAKTATFTAGSNFYYPCDATTGAIVANLPPAVTAAGRLYAFKKLDNVNDVTITPNGAETIDGAANKVLTTQYKAVLIYCDGVTWHILAQL